MVKFNGKTLQQNYAVESYGKTLPQSLGVKFYRTIYVKCLRTPILSNSAPLLHANQINHRRFEIYSKRAFFCRQGEVSSSNSLEMRKDRNDTYIFSKYSK